MIKLVYCIVRRADLSAEEFHRTWLVDHAPLVKSVAKALHAVRYIQSHAVHTDLNALLQSTRGGMQPAYDGITEIWWNSRADLENALSSEAGRAASERLERDEARFIDFARSRIFITEEHDIF
jgi:uncharacterized protein (TIGR02118 family)